MTKLEQQTNLPKLDIEKYKVLAPRAVKNLLEFAKSAQDKVVIHVNATPKGGGVAEMLASQLPLEHSLGLKSFWLTIKAPAPFFEITKKFHNLLQGKDGALTKKEKDLYLKVNRALGKSLKKFCSSFDRGVVVIHDPQPLPLIDFIPQSFVPALRLHIDFLTPDLKTLQFLKPFIKRYAAVILSNRDYIPPFAWLKRAQIKIIPPAIDPFSAKNKQMPLKTAQAIIKRFNISPAKPLATQISRFDPWKDPLGVLRAYRIAKKQIPDLQLALVGLMLAKDDPEAISVFEEVRKASGADKDIHLFADPKKLGRIANDKLVNAFQAASTVIVQKSIREGFGLTMTEAMWKGKAVVAGKTSGAKAQIKNGKSGILVSSPEETARAIVRLVKDSKLRKRLSREAKRQVQKKFIMPHYLLNNLKIYLSLI